MAGTGEPSLGPLVAYLGMGVPKNREGFLANSHYKGVRVVVEAPMTQPPPLIQALRRLAGPRPDDRSDAELLARFVGTRDPAAFAALVHRHGRLVWGACRRRASDTHAAEDAFQTTFLALARNAAAVRRPEAVAAWLHRVAVRCTAALRTPREPMSALPPEVPTRDAGPAAAAEGRDLERVIDAEIDALPEPFRLAFVLCEVEERTAAEAAAALGCAVGTVESRLTRARERLRARLARRGVTVGALVGLGLAADAVPAQARAAAVAQGTGAAPVAFARAALADHAARGPLSAAVGLGAGLTGAVLLVGVGGLLWAGGRLPESPVSSALTRSLPIPDLQVPEAEQFRRNRQNFPLPPEAIARVGDPWLRHAGSPDRLAFSQDGRFLATGALGDRWLRVWDLTTGRPRTHLSLAPDEVPVALALTADGGTLRAVVRTSADATQLRQYDTFRGLETHRRPIPNSTAATFDRAGERLALTQAGAVRVFNAASAAQQWLAEVPGAHAVEVAFVGGDRLAVLRTEADRVRLFDLATGTPADELVEAGAKMTFPAVSADGRTLAVWLPLRNRVRVWDLTERRIVHTFEPRFPPSGLDVAPDGSQLAVFTQWRGAALWDARITGKPRDVQGTGGEVGRFSADGSVLAVVSGDLGVVELADAKTGALVPTSPGETPGLLPVSFRPDGRRLLLQALMRWLDCPTAGDDPAQVISPGPAPGEKYTLPAAERAALSDDRTLLARVLLVNPKEPAYVIEVLDAATQTVRARIPVTGRRPVRLTFAPDNRTVYAINDKHVCGWDVASGQQVMRGRTPAGEVVYRLIVSPDGRHLATAVHVLIDAQRSGSIQVWDARTGESLFAAEAGHARPFVAFAADGKRFAAAAVPDRPAQHASEVRVWDLDTRAVTATFPGYDGQPAFSPDGRTLAVTRDDHVVLLEFTSGQVRHVFQHHGPVKPALAWRPDGRVLAAASPEAPVYLWDVFGDRTRSAAAWDPAHQARRTDALSGRAADTAFDTIRELWAHPAEAAEFLRTHIPPDADARLACRACEALELPAADAGRQLLAEWAAGPADTPRTREAKAAVRRLGATESGGPG